jgi:hypothetical protein
MNIVIFAWSIYLGNSALKKKKRVKRVKFGKIESNVMLLNWLQVF